MKKIYLLLWLIPGFLSAQIERPIGINLNGITDYSPELVFTDAFKNARSWIPFNADGTGQWDSGVEVPLNENGYPLQIPYDNGVDVPQAIRTLMLWSLPDEGFPQGNYRLIVKGKGEVRLRNSATGTFTTPVDVIVPVNGGSGVELQILSSDVFDPISDIKFILPDYTETYQEKTFTDEFMTYIKDFQVIRFMDWLRTNNSTVETWSDRTLKTRFSQSSENGIAWEYIVELANTAKKDIWICIPHLVDDDYIKKTAELLQNTLHSNIKIYVEYSNEVWNNSFQQGKDSWDQGEAAGLGEYHAGWKWTSKRSADLFYIFEQVFTNDERLVKIIPSQAAYAARTQHLVDYFNDPVLNPHGVKADAIAIAPYFAGSVANQIVEENLVETITPEEIVARMETSLPIAYDRMESNLQIANESNLKLICYEGGQHLVATGANVNIEMLTEKLITANRHPTIEDLYCQYFNYWYENAGGLFANFASHGNYSKYGSWGIKEHMNDLESPKYLGLKNCVFNHNNVEEPDPDADADQDGVVDTEDDCPNTPSGVTVNPNGCELFSLPSSNFTIQAIDESCANNNNGIIKITANETYEYSVILSGNDLNLVDNFTDKVEFPDLSAGEYTICVSVDDKPHYEQCYTVTISEPENLFVESRIDISNKSVTLNLSGAEIYIIEINQTVYKTSNKVITLPLAKSSNDLIVKTDKDCQGSHKEIIDVYSEPVIYPNPIENNFLTVELGEIESDEPIELNLFSLDGKQILKQGYRETQGKVDLDMTGMEKGVYILQIGAGKQTKAYKILRK